MTTLEAADRDNYMEICQYAMRWMEDAVSFNCSNHPQLLKDQERYKMLLDWLGNKSIAQSVRELRALEQELKDGN